MSHWMKRSLAALGACALLLTGCNDAQQETDKNTDSEPVEITENDVYLVPDDPTAYMKTAYDEVSSALNEADEEKEAEAVAKLFIADFFTLSNKTADTDVGGLEYIASASYDDMSLYARYYFYNNYSDIKTYEGEDQLPAVVGVEVTSITPADVTYGVDTYSGYEVSARIQYADTSVSDLKTEVTLRLARMDDYDHDTREEMESGELEEIPEAKNLFRVISLS